MATSSEDEANHSGVSAEGCSFRFEFSPDEAFPPGSFVTFRQAPDRSALGQVESNSERPAGRAAASGRILGVIDEGGRLDPLASSPFRSAEVAAAEEETIELLHRATGATLEVGSLTTNPDVPARLLPHRFNRRTFWCGQTGSGKTYALGVVLEQLLAHTDLPLVIFDPNGDFVRLPDLRADAPGEAAERRKFGLWLLLSTQRPSKVHPSINSQCDNLALMKMSSPLDLTELGAVFGFAPAALLSQSPASARVRPCSPAGLCRLRALCRSETG